MRIRIGKSEDNDLVIDNLHVSRFHAVLVDGENTDDFVLEDLHSTNGTFVNGVQIVKKHVSAKDSIVFGNDCAYTLKDILKVDNDYSDDFADLKAVYDSYIQEKIRIQSSNQFKARLIQSTPFAVIGIVGVIHSLKGGEMNQAVFIASIVLLVCAPALGIYLGARQAAKIPAKLQNLSNKFRIDYVCPKCGTFLGEIPWESLKNKERCSVSSCRAKWVRK